jgi:glycosyltransferase involved in cell wall biosynthesis
VCLIGPSLDILGGQAVQLDRLRSRLEDTPGVTVGFIPVNPRLPGPLGSLQRVKYLRTVVTSLAYLTLLLRHARRYDVLHTFSPSYWAFLLGPVPALAIGRLFGCRVVLNYHSGEAEDHLRRWHGTVSIARRFDRIAVPSAYLRDVFAAFGLEAVAIHNFVNADAIPFRERAAPRPVFLSNRNLEPMYNVACCIRAFARIQAGIPDARLVVSGFGSQRAELEALVAQLRLRQVRFTGRVAPDEMGRLLDAADILLNSPDIDNMPLSLIEAQAAGLPIVSTSTGGIPHVVSHGRTGLLVPPGDDAGMAQAALRLVEEPGLALRLSRQARADCLDRFTWQAVQGEWVRFYRDLVPLPAGAR